MTTEEQEKWLNHLSDTDSVTIIPFDPTSNEKFEIVKAKIQSRLGVTISVEHHGATNLRISGQDEIDIYVPVSPENFTILFGDLVKLLSEPRSHYPQQRARFVTIEGNKHIDIFLINQEHANWINLVKFEKYLLEHPDTLNAYKNLKESCNGLSTRKYYRKKTEFINSILAL